MDLQEFVLHMGKMRQRCESYKAQMDAVNHYLAEIARKTASQEEQSMDIELVGSGPLRFFIDDYTPLLVHWLIGQRTDLMFALQQCEAELRNDAQQQLQNLEK